MTTEIESQIAQHNCNDYKSWSYQEAAEWIISINSSKFEKYREALNNSCSAKDINFESIEEDEDLKQYGITDSNDRKTIYIAITQLISTQPSLAESTDLQTFGMFLSVICQLSVTTKSNSSQQRIKTQKLKSLNCLHLMTRKMRNQIETIHRARNHYFLTLRMKRYQSMMMPMSQTKRIRISHH